MSARLTSALLVAATLALSAHGSAFCRATTCDPSRDACDRDDDDCLVSGTPLAWASSCLKVWVQANGSPKQGISFDATKHSVTRAFSAWMSADCGSGSPLIEVQVLGPITCAVAEYNSTQKNANIVAFRDDDWPYIGGEDALGFTDLHFDANTGEIWDADIEINSVMQRYSVGDLVNGADLDSVLTHEAGHLLGLAHTLVPDATMFANYTEGTDSLRTLEDDDVHAVCAAYPPDRVPSRTSCTPRHGFSDACSADQPANSATNEGTDQEANSGSDETNKGCTFSNAPACRSWPSIAALLGVACRFARRRRSQRRQGRLVTATMRTSTGRSCVPPTRHAERLPSKRRSRTFKRKSTRRWRARNCHQIDTAPPFANCSAAVGP